MDFVSAIKTIKAQRGVTNAFYAMLCDYGAFVEEERWVQGIVKQICESGLAIRLSTLSDSNRQWETEVGDMMYGLTSQFAYREDAVSYIFHKLCLGLGLVGASYDWAEAFRVGSSQSVSHSSMFGSSSGFSSQVGKAKGSGSTKGHDYVDLGLPSGTLWAICNVGASKPEDFGNHYAWGETELKDYYYESNYKYANVNLYHLTKYDNSRSWNHTFQDNLTTLQASDDSATANWGSGWSTPTKAQWDELLAYTTNKVTTRNGVKGCLFTAKNGSTLFLPAAGLRCDSKGNHSGSDGYYWSRSLYIENPENAWRLYFGSYETKVAPNLRFLGFSVRPVRVK